MIAVVRVFFQSRGEIALEVLALRQQVAVLKRKKTKAAQWRFITDPANRPRLATVLGRNDFPSRSRWYDRSRRADWCDTARNHPASR